MYWENLNQPQGKPFPDNATGRAQRFPGRDYGGTQILVREVFTNIKYWNEVEGRRPRGF